MNIRNEGLDGYSKYLEELKECYNQRKKEYELMKAQYAEIDQCIHEVLFSLAEETINDSNLDPKSAIFSFGLNDNRNLNITEGHYQEYNNNSSDKKHRCPRPGCNKAYTSNHGLKYHLLNGHKTEKTAVIKPYACSIPGCGKTYRNSNGLKYHMGKEHPYYHK